MLQGVPWSFRELLSVLLSFTSILASIQVCSEGENIWSALNILCFSFSVQA